MSALGELVQALIRRGFPESTAVKIASGDLPMDHASRMARAREQGFDVDEVWYHGTPDNRGLRESGFQTQMERFGQVEDDPRKAFFFSKDRSTAATYADDTRAFDYQNADPEVLELLINKGDTKSIGWGGRPFRGDGYALADEIDAARDEGLQSLRVDNIRDTYHAGGRPDSVLVKMESEGIRDASNAAFDPDNVGLNHLLGAADPRLLGATAAGTYGAMRGKSFLDDHFQARDHGELLAAENPKLIELAQALMKVDTPIGNPLEGVADLLMHLGQVGLDGRNENSMVQRRDIGETAKRFGFAGLDLL